MKLARSFITLLLCAALPLPAFAQPHVIAQLGTAPLIGQIASTAQLQADAGAQKHLFEAAGTKLGLTPQEYAQFRSRIASRRLTYVTIPRHLDAMSWSSGGRVYVLHDVVIPANTKGWEIDLQEAGQTVALFIPARCGNLSIVRKPLPQLATAPARILPVQAPPAEVLAASSVVIAVPAAPAATPAAYEAVAVSSPPVHHARLWPLLLIPLFALLAGHHGGTPAIGTASFSSPPAAPTPPPVVSCPTPAPH